MSGAARFSSHARWLLEHDAKARLSKQRRATRGARRIIRRGKGRPASGARTRATASVAVLAPGRAAAACEVRQPALASSLGAVVSPGLVVQTPRAAAFSTRRIVATDLELLLAVAQGRAVAFQKEGVAVRAGAMSLRSEPFAAVLDVSQEHVQRRPVTDASRTGADIDVGRLATTASHPVVAETATGLGSIPAGVPSARMPRRSVATPPIL